MVKLNFQNFYVFEIVISVIIFISLGNSTNVHWFLRLGLLALAIFILWDGIGRWNKEQRSNEKLKELEIQRKEATLDFDIKHVNGINDIHHEPEDFDENLQPTGWKLVETVELKLFIMVYNPSLVENVIRDIAVNIKQKRTLKKMKQIVFTPTTINPRKHLRFDFTAHADDFHGKDDDEVIVELTTMDNKKVKKETIVESYEKGQELREATATLKK